MVKHPRAIVGTLAGLFTAFVLSACGGDDTSGAQTLPQGSALPQGSEPVNLDAGRLHHPDRQPVLADGAG